MGKPARRLGRRGQRLGRGEGTGGNTHFMLGCSRTTIHDCIWEVGGCTQFVHGRSRMTIDPCIIGGEGVLVS